MKLVVSKCFWVILLVSSACSTNKNESNLTQNDINFIRNLGILEGNEEIEMFESNGGFKGLKKSGNFITSKRIASYWLGDDEREIYSASFHSEIDSIAQTDLITKLTYASYLTVFKTDGSNFKVYVDADSARTYKFFSKARNNWLKSRTNN